MATNSERFVCEHLETGRRYTGVLPEDIARLTGLARGDVNVACDAARRVGCAYLGAIKIDCGY